MLVLHVLWNGTKIVLHILWSGNNFVGVSCIMELHKLSDVSCIMELHKLMVFHDLWSSTTCLGFNMYYEVDILLVLHELSSDLNYWFNMFYGVAHYLW